MQRLSPHPDFPFPSVTYVESEVIRSQNGVIYLRYVLAGTRAGVRLPPMALSARADDLWRHTCFEAFVQAEGEQGYLELNLSPSTEWAAYAFEGYRQGMRPADLPPPTIETARSAERLELRAAIDLKGLIPLEKAWRVGLTAVVETQQGLSCWALAHPPGKPDFHRADCFALELPATERS
jgi:hypothetical protein